MLAMRQGIDRPVPAIQIVEYAVLTPEFLNDSIDFVWRDRPVVCSLRQVGYPVESVQMIPESALGIVCRSRGGDEERPVAALGQYQFPGGQGDDGAGMTGGKFGCHPTQPPLGRVERFPNPSVRVVQPDIVSSPLAPRALWKGDIDGRRNGTQRFRASYRHDLAVTVHESGELEQKLRPLRPPMTE